MFIGGGVEVYEGMDHWRTQQGKRPRGQSHEIQKADEYPGVRSDEAVRLTTPRTLRLEEAISYIDDDELVEVTPQHIRIRKRLLNPHDRKRIAKSRKQLIQYVA